MWLKYSTLKYEVVGTGRKVYNKYKFGQFELTA